MQLPKGLDNLLEMVERRVKPHLQYFPYPPVTNKAVAWVVANMPALQAIAQMPVAEDGAHRNAVAVLVANLFMLYTRPVDRTMTPDQMTKEVARRKIIADSFIADLSTYPVWAVAAGITSFRKTPESQFEPKTPGPILDHISREYTRACRAIVAAERVLEADRLGHNVDSINRMLNDLGNEAINPEQKKAHAEAALKFMAVLEKACDVSVDPVARNLHIRCHRIWHEWRRNNPLKEKP